MLLKVRSIMPWIKHSTYFLSKFYILPNESIMKPFTVILQSLKLTSVFLDVLLLWRVNMTRNSYKEKLMGLSYNLEVSSIIVMEGSMEAYRQACCWWDCWSSKYGLPGSRKRGPLDISWYKIKAQAHWHTSSNKFIPIPTGTYLLIMPFLMCLCWPFSFRPPQNPSLVLPEWPISRD